MTVYLDTLPSRAGSEFVHVVIDTPKGSRNKFKYDPVLRCFKLGRVLPLGASFPYDFGSIPRTLCEDGDALDAMVLGDVPCFAGCLVVAKLVGGIAGEQTESGKTIRNDRLLAVPVTPVNPPVIAHIAELADAVLREIEHFFVSYNQAHGRRFTPLERLDRKAAEAILADSERRYAEAHR